jgi:hypothetical protein
MSIKMGNFRPKFHHDAPLWFTILVFAFFITIILVAISN